VLFLLSYCLLHYSLSASIIRNGPRDQDHLWCGAQTVLFLRNGNQKSDPISAQRLTLVESAQARHSERPDYRVMPDVGRISLGPVQ
jgi:hypothetical protein